MIIAASDSDSTKGKQKKPRHRLNKGKKALSTRCSSNDESTPQQQLPTRLVVEDEETKEGEIVGSDTFDIQKPFGMLNINSQVFEYRPQMVEMTDENVSNN